MNEAVAAHSLLPSGEKEIPVLIRPYAIAQLGKVRRQNGGPGI